MEPDPMGRSFVQARQATLFSRPEEVPAAEPNDEGGGKPRLRYANRRQVEMRMLALDDLLPAEHTARLVWQYVSELDVSHWLVRVRAVEGDVGRAATDPHILIALWLLATLEGIGSARELARSCERDLAYQWICGGVSLNYHTLADFRTQAAAWLDDLLTKSIAGLRHQKLVELNCVAHDGMRVRAAAGSASFRRRPTLERFYEEAKTQVARLKRELEEEPNAASERERAARQRAAQQRQQRIQQALEEVQKLETQKESRQKGSADKARASTTDPEARVMKMGDGGFRPAYNVQFATTTGSRFVVGVDVTNQGSDGDLMQPMREQLKRRYDSYPEKYLADGGFRNHDDITRAEQDGTLVFCPVKELTKGGDPFLPQPKDTAEVTNWRRRMATDESKTQYRERASTAEWSNAQARNHGLQQFRVRGRTKALAIAFWHAIAHNLERLISLGELKRGLQT